MTAVILRDITNQDFSPFLADELVFGTIENPWPIMAEFRRSQPVSVGSYGAVFGAADDPAVGDRAQYTAWTYDTVREVLGNPDLFSSAIVHKINVEKAFGPMLLSMDPPDHTRHRRFVQSALSPRAVKGWIEQVIRPLLNELIDAFIADGSAELVGQFARRYPFEVVFRLLKLPARDIELFLKLAVSQTFVASPFLNEAIQAGENLADYFRSLVAERRLAPGDDLISQLLAVEVDGETIDEEILLSFLRTILNAAADTSFRVTGSLLVALLSNPDLLASVRAAPNLIPLAIDETLRWEGPVLANFRTLTRDHEMAGVRLAGGSVIYVAQGSANHDDKYFTDPDIFNLERSRTTPHLGFGIGPHFCVGMHLARAQIREAITTLLTRLPNLRLDPASPPPAIRGFLFRTPPELRVIF